MYLTWNKTACSAALERAPGFRPDAVEPAVLIYSLCTMSKSCVRLDGKTLEKCFTVKSEGMVGRGGLEPPTSRLSGVRSNHLSYRPIWWSLSLCKSASGSSIGSILVEPIGIEPMTLCLQSRCSPS